MRRKYFFSVLSFFHFVSGSATELGTRNNPVKMAIIPSSQAKNALEKAKPLAQCVEKVGKIALSVSIPSSYVAVTEGMGSERVDIAFGDIVSYLLAKQKYDVEPILQVIRTGTDYYRSAIFVRKNSSIKSIQDLNNKRFAYNDASSPSGYIFPMIMMHKNKIKFSQEVASGSMDASLNALMQDQVDAAAGFYLPPDAKDSSLNDARIRILNLYPDIEKETRILWLSKPIPNAPVFVRKDLPQSLKEKLTSSISTCIKRFPRSINSMDDLIPIKKDDHLYDNFIKEVENSGLNISGIFKWN